MVMKEKILTYIDEQQKRLFNANDSIWEYAETRYEEYQSAGLLCQILEEEGFTVTKGVADMNTAFVASYGSGKPVIGLLGEYDALYGLSQEAGISEKKARETDGKGHGCGHHTLGVGTLAAALALKEYLKENNIPGTVKYFGCPAEEGGCGKVYMARAGYFNDVDAVFSWHPFSSSNIMTFNVLATISAYFKFHGQSAHASGTPHMGRSALDAVALMNAGVNYLREHVEQDTRMHYAITDTGGNAPHIVPANAAVLHQIRTPKLTQARAVYERVINIAKGAALMTDTKLEIVFDKASSNMLHNHVLCKLLYEKFQEVGTVLPDEKDIEYARQIRATLSEQEKRLDENYAVSMFGDVNGEITSQIAGKEIIDILYPCNFNEIVAMGSSDMGDVSWNVPTASFQVAAYAKDTSPHSWQQVAQGKADLTHKALLQAGKVMALAAVELLENPGLVAEARKEFDKRLGGERYICPIPQEVMPSPLR